jgi:hypothetical protein
MPGAPPPLGQVQVSPASFVTELNAVVRVALEAADDDDAIFLSIGTLVWQQSAQLCVAVFHVLYFARRGWDTERPQCAQTDLELHRYLKKRVLVLEVGEPYIWRRFVRRRSARLLCRETPSHVVIMSYGAAPSPGDAHLVVQ